MFSNVLKRCITYNFSLERHIIAALHFNHNLHADVKKNPRGTEQMKVVQPKFKNGEATVRDVKVEPNFGKMQTIRFQNGHEVGFCMICTNIPNMFGASVAIRSDLVLKSIDQLRCIKFQLKTVYLSLRLWGITTEFVGFIPRASC